MTQNVPYTPIWYLIATVAIGVIASLQFIVPITSFPNITIKFEINQTNANISKIEVTNNGNARATNVILVFQAPTSIIMKNIFSTENYSISNAVDNSKTLRLFLPRISSGGGSLISIESVTNASKASLSNSPYSVFLTFDQGSIKSEIPVSSVKTIEQQGPSRNEIISVVAFTGFFGFIAFGPLVVAARTYRNPKDRGRFIASAIVGGSFVVITVFFWLLALHVIKLY